MRETSVRDPNIVTSKVRDAVTRCCGICIHVLRAELVSGALELEQTEVAATSMQRKRRAQHTRQAPRPAQPFSHESAHVLCDARQVDPSIPLARIHHG